MFGNGSKKAPRKTDQQQWQEKNQRLLALIRERDIDRALAEGQELVEFVDRRFRRDAPEKATAYNNMGMAFMLARDWELAEQSFRDALAMRRRLLGSDHNEVALILMNLSQLFKTRAQEILAANRLEVE